MVEEEVLIVDCGSLKMKGIPWKGAILMEDDGGLWKRNCGRLYTAPVMDPDWRLLQHGRFE